VDGVVGQLQAESRVVGVGTVGPDQVPWVDEPHRELLELGRHVLLDRVSEKRSDVAELLAGERHPQVRTDGLTEPHRHDDHAVLPPLEIRVDQSQDGGEVHPVLRDEHNVRAAERYRGLCGDETGKAPVQLHNANAVHPRPRLDLCSPQALDCELHASRESKCTLDESNIVVDSLRNAHDGDVAALARDLVHQRLSSLLGPIAADREKDIDPELVHILHHLTGELIGAIATRRAKKRAARLVDVPYHIRIQLRVQISQ